MGDNSRQSTVMIFCCLWIIIVINIIYMADERLQAESALSFVQSMQSNVAALGPQPTHNKIQHVLKTYPSMRQAWLLTPHGQIQQHVQSEVIRVAATPMQHTAALLQQLQHNPYAFIQEGDQIAIMLPIRDKTQIIAVVYFEGSIAFVGDNALHILEIMLLTLIFAFLVMLRLKRGEQYRALSIVNSLKKIRHHKDFTLPQHAKSLDELNVVAREINLLLADLAARDMQEKKQQAALVTKLTYYDALTSLPNRYKLNEIIARHIDNNTYPEGFYLLRFDIANFTAVNQQLGEEKADEILKAVATYLHNFFNSDVARTGADDFCVIVTDKRTTIDWVSELAPFFALFRDEKWHQEYQSYLSFSVGVAHYPMHATTADDLFKCCELACYSAKNGGKNVIVCYEKSFQAAYSDMLLIESELHRALRENHFKLLYQAQYDVKTKTIIGAEALLRWEHPEYGLITPDRFIPIAEETGLIVPIGRWVLQQACMDCKRWQQSGFPQVNVSVNLSRVQFTGIDILRDVLSSLKKADLAPESLEVELTEGMLITSDSQTVGTLAAMKRLGIKLSIDDFGTGYSSLRYISHFPLNTIKIDKSFILDIHNNQKNAEITGAIVALAHHLNLLVVAEGVETAAHVRYLEKIGCDILQGYFIARPQSYNDFVKFLDNQGFSK